MANTDDRSHFESTLEMGDRAPDDHSSLVNVYVSSEQTAVELIRSASIACYGVAMDMVCRVEL